MKKYLHTICIIISVCLFYKNTFAEALSYESYLSGSTVFCDNPSAEWNSTPRSVRKIFYPKLQSQNINEWRDTQIANETSSLGREYLAEALKNERISDFDGYRALEVAQNVYHARMNTLFDCGVIESRIKIIEGLKNLKALQGQSELIKKLNREKETLNTKYKQCLPDESSNTENTSTLINSRVNMRMVNTATYQYCHYRKYLSYLESQLTDNTSNTMTVDGDIGGANSGIIPKTSVELHTEVIRRQSQIAHEIYRADSVLPRAIRAFKEMERTYAMHLLLVIIYDDFVQLRDNLHQYMNATSQLFEKAYNAMSP